MMDSSRLPCALIVTFEPGLDRLKQVFLAAALQAGTVLVIDNGSSEQGRIAELVAGAGGRFHPLKTNRGIALAQNIGLRWAFKQGFPAVLLLDQDSVPQPAMCGILWKALERLREEGIPVAAVAPRLHDPRNDGLLPLVMAQTDAAASQADVFECGFLIASGMLISRESFAAVGAMDSRLFIDHVDTEWCLRARSLGWRLFAVDSARLSHCLGEGGGWAWFGRWRFIPFHPPLRHYYVIRNTLHLCRRPYVPLGFCLRMLWRTFGVVGLSFFLLPGRWRRFWLVMEAVADAGCNRLGRREAKSAD